MKYIRYTYHLVTVVLIILLTSLQSCNSEDLSQEKSKPTVIEFSLSNVQTRGAALFTGDSQISKVRVYVFSGNYVDAMRVYSENTEEFKNPFRILTSTGPKTVYVIANEPDGMSASLDAVTTLAQLKAIETPATLIPLSVPLTMVGSENVNVVYVPEPGAPTQVTVKLTRLAAQITLKVKKGAQAEAAGTEIILRGVRLFRALQKSALIEGQPISEKNYWHYNYTGPGNITLTTSGVDAWTGATPMYVYENIGTKADTLNRAMYLIVDAIYKGVNTQYRAYINDETATADAPHPFAIKRNHRYDLTATINNIGEFDGLTLSTYVMPWDKLSSTINYERTFTISPQPTSTNHTYTVNNTADAVTFTFKLTNPIYAKWAAHLSNPLNFEVTPIGAQDLGEYTITIKPKYDQASLTEDMETEFHITVGGEHYTGTEIPLLQGITLIGPGNRIIIKQPKLTTP